MAEDEPDEDFKYIIRVSNTDLDGHQPLKTALTSVKGIGQRVSNVVARELGVEPTTRAGDLSDEQVEQLQEIVDSLADRLPGWMVNRSRDLQSGENLHIIAGDIDMYKRDDINRLKKISCYRGVRHEHGQKVRGQRTRSNGRSGLALGVSRAEQKKKAKEEAD